MKKHVGAQHGAVARAKDGSGGFPKKLANLETSISGADLQHRGFTNGLRDVNSPCAEDSDFWGSTSVRDATTQESSPSSIELTSRMQLIYGTYITIEY